MNASVEPDFVEINLRDHVLYLHLNREERKNALNHGMYSRLAEAIENADEDPQIRVVLIYGTLLFHLLRFQQLFEDMHVMLQKEVIQRMTATPGNKTYGRLTVALAARCEVESLFNIGPGAFTPATAAVDADQLPFDAQKIYFWKLTGTGRQEAPFSRADIHLQRPVRMGKCSLEIVRIQPVFRDNA